MLDWNQLSFRVKLNILEGESTVLFDLLLECEKLVIAIKNGATQAECLKIINESF